MKFFLIALLIFIPLFLLRYHTAQPKFSPGDRVRITVRLAQEPLLINDKQLFTVSNIRVFAPRFPEFHYGDSIVTTGVVRKKEKGWYIENPEIALLTKHGFLPKLRQRVIESFRKTIPEPESALIAGVTLGSKESISPEFFAQLKNSGMLHVVVASGMNVTLVARILINILVVWLARRIALPAALFGIWSYVFLIGLEPPIIRAALMGSLAFIAEVSGRLNLAWWSLFLAGAVMLLIWPSWVTDVGFLLSFAATAGILAFETPIKDWIEARLRLLPGFLKQDFSISIAAQIGTTPILFVAFGQFVPWSPLINTALLWTIAPMTILGFLGGFIGLIFELPGRLFILLAYPLTWLFVKIVELF